MKLGTKHVIHKILLRKRIDMVAGMQVSYLAGKSVFYRPEHNAKRRPQHVEFWRFWNSKMKYTTLYQKYDLFFAANSRK